MGQWQFYVVGADHVGSCGYTSVTIAWVRRFADAVTLDELAAAIRGAAA